ncbi:hypothetical protein [Mycobacterium intracellulare]|uniref:hypothetical protein n=1 Tax=Mycobacterium intracellulare TaxID=1767 RepID=UPI001041F19F|nr:hypothetical protein [Mycobacterium intracellulare]
MDTVDYPSARALTLFSDNVFNFRTAMQVTSDQICAEVPTPLVGVTWATEYMLTVAPIDDESSPTRPKCSPAEMTQI